MVQDKTSRFLRRITFITLILQHDHQQLIQLPVIILVTMPLLNKWKQVN